MVLDILFILVGICMVLWGANLLTEGSVALASRMGVSQLVIGLTVVAFGTSMPEFCVSLMSAIKGTPDLAVGNILGSNIFNSMLIVGVAAAVAPMAITEQTIRKDIPFALVASVILTFCCIDGDISRWDAALLAVLFIVYMTFTLKDAKSGKATSGGTGDGGGAAKKERAVWMSVVFVIAGLACLVSGSNLFVDHASALAASLSVPESVIGLTIVAGGTSLPELATSVVAARKGNSGIAIGNVIGSNVFNILFILGATGLICPMEPNGITYLDMAIMTGSVITLWLFSYTEHTIARWEGAVLAVAYIGYVGYLISGVI